jgi:general secretion pathway protein G
MALLRLQYPTVEHIAWVKWMSTKHGNTAKGQRPASGLQRGFTLIEILVVVVILSILATVVVLNVADAPDQGRIAKARTDIRMLESAMEMYRLHNYSYPSTEQGLQALVNRPGGQPEAPNWKPGGYIKQLQKDPWGRDYVYLRPGSHGEFDLYTMGRDGQVGGEGADADIGNWSSD